MIFVVSCDEMTTSTPRIKRRKVVHDNSTSADNTEVAEDNESSTLMISGVEDVTESTLQCTQSILGMFFCYNFYSFKNHRVND